jgi:hydroxymethylbilane synthase
LDEIRIGTRGSRLALAQAQMVADMLKSRNPAMVVELVSIRTAGDVMPPERRRNADGKTAFTKEIEESLLRGDIDLAVHSAKDIPSEMDGRLVLAATPPRGDHRDALVSRLAFEELPRGARIGTSSVRRKAQLLRLRSDVEVVEVHGNVETRIGKVGRGGLDGVVLAAAGLARIGLEGSVTRYFEVGEMVPAPCQGIIAVEARRGDSKSLSAAVKIDDAVTHKALVCERAFSSALGGDCYVPIGAYAEVKGGRIELTGLVASPDGREVHVRKMGPGEDPVELGERLARALIEEGAGRVMEAARS